MVDVVEVPARLAETIAAAPAGLRSPSAAAPSSASSAAGAGVPASAAAVAAGGSPGRGPTVSLSVAGSHVALDSSALVALVSASLRHEDTLHQVAARAGVTVDELLGSLQRAVTGPDTSSFTDAEVDVLAAARVDLAGPAAGAAGVHVAGLAAAHGLVADALTVDDAAAALAVTPGRVRQRLSAGELLHVRRADGQTGIPRWQIRDGRLVPHLKELRAELPELHPLATARLMTAPHPDLDVDGEAVSPVDWLLTGGEVEPVLELLHSVALRG